MTKIAVFVGSLREQSTNMALAKALESMAPETMEFDYIPIEMPHFNEDVERAAFPPEVQAIKDRVSAADGILIVSPEYNRSVPGVLKNAIDWISRPYGQSSFVNKPVGIVGSSTSVVGTALGQADLRKIMLFQNAKVLGQPEVYVANAGEVFDDSGALLSERWAKNFQQFMDAFAAWVDRK
jgi:chromate reductase